MILSILVVVLIAGIAIRQGSQGFFSGLIMAMLTLCCAAGALNTYEWIGGQWGVQLIGRWNPDYTLPITLAVLFTVPLVLLRLLFDRLIRRACLLPAMVERVGGGLCGLLTALTMVGVAAICVQMVPFANGKVLGFSRVPAVNPLQQPPPPLPTDEKERNLWLSPDRFAAAVAALTSDGIFSGPHSFVKDHPDLVQAIAWNNATHPMVSRYAPPHSIAVVETAPVDRVYRVIEKSGRNEPKQTEYEPKDPPSGHEFRMVRVRLKDAARDARRAHVFALRQFRLVGSNPSRHRVEQYHPIAIQQADASQPVNRHVVARKRGGTFWPVIYDIFSPRDDNNNEVEVVFELPTGFQPSFIEYKLGARANVTFSEREASASPGRRSRPGPERGAGTTPASAAKRPAASASASSRPSRRRPSAGQRGGRKRGGRVRGVAAAEHGSHFGDALPMKMTAYRKIGDFDLARGRLVSGHLVGFVDEQEAGRDRPIERFDVPPDMRLLHLSSVRLHAGSTLGRALTQAVTVAQNYYVEDDQGNQYPITGKYAVATVGGRKVVEVIYYRDRVQGTGSVGAFQKINERNLGRGDTFVLLFLVKPGARIVKFSTGGSATRADDLRADHLVAPP